DATIVEAMLLRVAEETDRTPAVNVAAGKLRALDDIFQQHGTGVINVFGLDPLRPPEELPRITGRKCIVLRATSMTCRLTLHAAWSLDTQTRIHDAQPKMVGIKRIGVEM